MRTRGQGSGQAPRWILTAAALAAAAGLWLVLAPGADDPAGVAPATLRTYHPGAQVNSGIKADDTRDAVGVAAPRVPRTPVPLAPDPPDVVRAGGTNTFESSLQAVLKEQRDLQASPFGESPLK